MNQIEIRAMDENTFQKINDSVEAVDDYFGSKPRPGEYHCVEVAGMIDYLLTDRYLSILNLSNTTPKPTSFPTNFLSEGGRDATWDTSMWPPARFFKPSEVKTINLALASMSSDDLLNNYDPAEIAEVDEDGILDMSEVIGTSDDDSVRCYIADQYILLCKYILSISTSGKGIMLWEKDWCG